MSAVLRGLRACSCPHVGRFQSSGPFAEGQASAIRQKWGLPRDSAASAARDQEAAQSARERQPPGRAAERRRRELEWRKRKPGSGDD